MEARALQTKLGRISISAEAIAQIAARTAEECYGVVGLFGRGRVVRLLGRDRAAQGVTVSERDGRLGIEIAVIVEYGLNLAEVASTVRSRVSYELERLTGLDVAAVDVNIKNVRASA